MSTLLRRAAHWHRPLVLFVYAMAVLAVVAAAGLVFDDRVVTGAAAWLKPFKFAVSFVLYAGTLAWLLSLLPRRNRITERAATVVVAVSVTEMVIIVGQVIRGRASHFNDDTTLDATLFSIMGAAIMVLFVAHLVVAVQLLRSRMPDRSLRYAVAGGMLLAGLGMLAALPMTTGLNAHSVGVADGGPGLPITGWSTTGGDLRIGHFVGLHGLQALPLLLLVLRRWDESTRARLISVAGYAYGLLTLLLTVQALRGQPLLRPDALTLAGFGVLALGTAAATALVLRTARPVLRTARPAPTPGEPAGNAPAPDEPVLGKPAAADGRALGESAADEPVPGEPTADESVPGEPAAADEPALGKPPADDPAGDEPARKEMLTR